MKRINCIYLCLLFMGVFAVQPACSQEKAFKPVTFEKEHSVKVNGTPKEVFAIIARPERFKGHGNSKTEYLFGSKDELDGAMFRVGDIWFVVAEYNPTDFMFRYVMLMPKAELLEGEYSLKPTSDGGSMLTVRWRVTGFDERSNQAIQGYLDNRKGAFEKQVEALGKTLSDHFSKKKAKQQSH